MQAANTQPRQGQPETAGRRRALKSPWISTLPGITRRLAAAAAIGCAAVSCGFSPRIAAGQVTGSPGVSDSRPVATAISENAPIPTRHLFSIIQDGGVLMIPILFCSFLLFVFVFERTISLRRGRVIPEPFVKRVLHQIAQRQLDPEQACKLCDENRSPVARVFAAALQKWGRPAVEVEQAILDAGERSANDLRRYLRVFNGVATVSPLLGLLGTVVGMIRAFNAIATTQALGRPELLAAGISQALLTTAAGLSVAIPALIFYLFFISRVDKLIMRIDARGQELANLISADALGSSLKRAARPRRTDAA